MDAAPILAVDDVTKVYRRNSLEVAALRGVSLEVRRGESVAIMGPSGSGKSTLLNITAGLDRPTTGEVRVGGTRLSDLDAESATAFRRRHIGFVFQFFNLLPTMTARENVMLPLMAERLPAQMIETRTREALDAVGLAPRAAHRPGELSGGEQQRVAIARALVMRPMLLLADEPTGNLDSVAGEEILGLLRSAIDQLGLSVLLVTHSYVAAAAMDRVVTMRDGRLSDDIAARQVPASPPVQLRGIPGKGGGPRP